MKIAAVALTRGGKATAEKIQNLYPPGKVDLYLPSKLATEWTPEPDYKGGEVPESSRKSSIMYFQKPFREVFGSLFKEYSALICVMATGIVVRTAAPYLKDKWEDPAVVVVDEKGQFFISLLSGHLGGANFLVEQLASKTGGQAIITTATDVCKKPAVEMLARSINCQAFPRENIKKINGAFVNGVKVKAFIEKGLTLPENFPLETEVFEPTTVAQLIEGQLTGEQLTKKQLTFPGNNKNESDPERYCIIITSRQFPEKQILFLHPQNIVLGVGCKQGITSGQLISVIKKSFIEEGYSLHSLRKILSIDIKKEEKGLLEAAEILGVPIEFVSREQIRNLKEEVSHSDYVERVIGVGSVCEPAALIGAGRGELIWRKKKTAGITTAAARVTSRWWE